MDQRSTFFSCACVTLTGRSGKAWQATFRLATTSVNTLCPPFAAGKESAAMVFSERVVACLVLVLVLLMGHAGHSIRDQAPGDGDAICTDEIIDGVANPFFANHPVYSASERPLMDSRDYNRLLQESGSTYLPWQSVNKDTNSSAEVITEV